MSTPSTLAIQTDASTTITLQLRKESNGDYSYRDTAVSPSEAAQVDISITENNRSFIGYINVRLPVYELVEGVEVFKDFNRFSQRVNIVLGSKPSDSDALNYALANFLIGNPSVADALKDRVFL